jgi:hypothetical protein
VAYSPDGLQIVVGSDEQGAYSSYGSQEKLRTYNISDKQEKVMIYDISTGDIIQTIDDREKNSFPV